MYDFDTWWELTCRQTKSNYDVIVGHANILFITEEKTAVRKIAKSGIISPHACFYFCCIQKQHEYLDLAVDPQIPTCMENMKVCVLLIR